MMRKGGVCVVLCLGFVVTKVEKEKKRMRINREGKHHKEGKQRKKTLCAVRFTVVHCHIF